MSEDAKHMCNELEEGEQDKKYWKCRQEE